MSAETDFSLAWASMTVLSRAKPPITARFHHKNTLHPLSKAQRKTNHTTCDPSTVPSPGTTVPQDDPKGCSVAHAARPGKPWHLTVTRPIGCAVGAMCRHGRKPIVKGAVAVALGLALGMRAIPPLLPWRHPSYPNNNNNKKAANSPALLWLRSDLRLHDHEALVAANAACSALVPVFCFDPREFNKGSAGFEHTGPGRARFLCDCVSDMRESLRARGSDMVVVVGRPEEVLPVLAAQVGATTVHCHLEVSETETRVEGSVRAVLKKAGVALKTHWGGSTLHHPDDLPFKTGSSMPACYASFCKATGKVRVRQPLDAPQVLKPFPHANIVDVGGIPTLDQLGLPQQELAGHAARGRAGLGAGLKGGESEALRCLAAFVAHTRGEASHHNPHQQHLHSHQQAGVMSDKRGNRASGAMGTRSTGPALGSQLSCKISPWLAMGCLSPRKMYAELQAHVDPVNKGDPEVSRNWLVLELLWRDFFRFITSQISADLSHSPLVGGTAPLAAF